MPFLEVCLCVLFLASTALSKEETSAPSCTGVEDFGACLGNTDKFCPRNISCACKKERPFCRCEYFRVDWRDYWYMGPKCNHLWNTLDFILVATVPAAVLVIIVVVIFFCAPCSTGEKSRRNPYAAHHNPAFSAEVPANLGHSSLQPPMDPWPAKIPRPSLRGQNFDDVPISSQRDNYSPMYAQPFRAPGHFSPQQPQREVFDYPSNNLPYAGYPEGRQYREY